MDSLIKMALIKSAKYDFAEVELDKNNLFIGANGAGKTTLLRAILYFYTANAKTLGINSAKKISFLDYYFPFDESYIVYLYKKDKKFILVTLYKSTTIKFRFCMLNSAPNIQELYVENNKPIEHTLLWAKLRELGLLSKTLNAKEYKEVLYAKHSKFKQYSLFEAKEYDGFIKTVSNIFINNKVDSQAIKKVIVSSLNVEKEIDIEQIKRQLNIFNTTYEDIQAYDKNIKSIEKLIDYLDGFELINKQLQDNLSTLLASKEQNYIRIINFEKENIEYSLKSEELETKLKKEKSLYDKRVEILIEKIGVTKGLIKLTKEKVNYYKEHHIEKKLKDFNNLKSLKNKLNIVVSQKEFLTKEYAELSFAHSNRLQSIENNFNEELNKLEKDKSGFSLKIMKKISELKDKQRDSFQEVQQEFLSEEKKLIEQNSNLSLELQKEEIVYKNLQKEEFSFKDNKKIENLELSHQELTLKLTQTKYQLDMKNQELEQEESLARNAEEFLSDKQKEVMINIDKRVQGVKDLISPKKGTLLHSIYEQNLEFDKYIYFIKDELLHSEINFAFSTTSMKLFEVDVKEKIAKSKLQDSLSSLIKEKMEEKDNFSLELQKLQNSFKNKQNSIYRDKRHLNDKIKKIQRELDILKTQLTQLMDIKRVASDRFEEQKRKEIEILKESIQNIQNQKLLVVENLTKLKNIKDKRLSSKKAQFTKQFKSIEKEEEFFMQEIQEKQSTILLNKNQALKEQEKLYEKSLLEKNIDVEELQKLTKQETLLHKDIELIESYSSIISNYERDKDEYIDRLKENELKLKEYQDDKEKISLRFNVEDTKLREELKSLGAKYSDNLKTIEKLQEEIQRVINFEDSASMRECNNLGLLYEKSNNIGDINELLENISNLLVLYRENEKSISIIVGKLSSIFDTTLNIKYSANPLKSAYSLQEFHLDKKIEHYKELQVTTLNQIIKSSIDQYDNLMHHSSQIESLVRKITKLFREIQIGVIDELSLRYSRTNNRVIERLSRVKELNSENPNGYGVTLFNDGSNSKEMIKLLKNLRDTIELESVGSIDLEDSFVLEFRVVENGNDSRYQTSLDNIGSNGTDVLVKSMIYIAMLHIFKSKTTSKKLAINVILDEIGILSQRYLKELIEFANRYNIYFINGAPDEKLISTYKRVSLISNINNKSVVQELIAK